MEAGKQYLGKPKALRKNLSLSTRERELAESRAALLKMFADKEQLKREAALARREASDLREHIIVSATATPIVSLRNLGAAAIAIVLATALSKITYVHSSQQKALKAIPAAAAAPPLPLTIGSAPMTPIRYPVDDVGRFPSSAADVKFEQAVARMQAAFDSLPESQVEIVRELNQQHPDGPMACPLDWSDDGRPTLYVGGEKEDPLPSIPSALNRCADAAEKLRAEREVSHRAQETRAH